MSAIRIPLAAALATVLLLLPLPRAGTAHAQRPDAPVRRADVDAKLVVPDSSQAQTLTLRDGSTLLGRIVDAGADTVRFQTSYATIAIPRDAIVDVRVVKRPSVGPSGELWPVDPNATRLFFAPTGRMLEAGDGYFSDTYLFFLGFFRGVTDRVTMGAGMSIVPTGDFLGDNVFYAMPKVGIIQQPTFNVAVGGLVGTVPADASHSTFGIGYGVATAGDADASVTAGLGYGFMDGEVAEQPLVMLGLHKRLSRRTAFVSENYLVPGADGALVSYGLRIFGEKLGVDLALWNVLSGDNGIPFPGVPYIAFVSHF